MNRPTTWFAVPTSRRSDGQAFWVVTFMPRRHPAVGRPDVRLVVHLQQAAGVVVAGRQQAAGPVVLEAAREDPVAAGGESRDDRVPLERLAGGAVEA